MSAIYVSISRTPVPPAVVIGWKRGHLNCCAIWHPQNPLTILAKLEHISRESALAAMVLYCSLKILKLALRKIHVQSSPREISSIKHGVRLLEINIAQNLLIPLMNFDEGIVLASILSLIGFQS